MQPLKRAASARALPFRFFGAASSDRSRGGKVVHLRRIGVKVHRCALRYF